MVQALAAGDSRYDPPRRPRAPHRRPGLRLRRGEDRLRDLRGRLGRRAAGRRDVAARRRYHPQPQRQPLRLRQVRRSQAAGLGGLAGVPRWIRLCQPAGQRGRPRDLRRRGPGGLRRRLAGCRAAVQLCSLAAHVRCDRPGGQSHEHSAADQFRAQPGRSQRDGSCRGFLMARRRPRAVPSAGRGLGSEFAAQGRGVRARSRPGALRLSPQEPLAGLRRQPQRRRRFVGRLLPGRADGRPGLR